MPTGEDASNTHAAIMVSNHAPPSFTPGPAKHFHVVFEVLPDNAYFFIRQQMIQPVHHLALGQAGTVGAVEGADRPPRPP
jgi:hypothetical protein